MDATKARKPSRLTPQERRAVVSAVLDGAFGTGRFYVLLGLATIIAAGGLLANSTAVIIGAMIVAPLMGPILGLSLGMITGRRRLEFGALWAEASGIAMTVGLGYLAGLVPLNLGVSAEMLSRTAPNAFDLGIAFASGLAGAYVTVNRKVNSAIAGVAVAVALVPPLATCGLLLAMGHRHEALGAFLLFGANFFAIQLAAALVFGLYGFVRTSKRHLSAWPLVERFLPGVIAVAVMAWVMTGTLVALVRDHDEETTVHDVLTEQIARRSGGRLESVLSRKKEDGGLTVVASALTPQVFEPAQVAGIEQALRAVLKGRVRLVLRSIVSQDVDDAGRVYLTDEERSQSKEAKASAASLAMANDVLKRGLRNVTGAQLSGLDRQDSDGKTVLVALVRGPVAVDPPTVGTLEDALRKALGADLRLIVRNVTTHDTDREGLLYQAQPEDAPPPDPLVVRLRMRIRDVLARRLASQPARGLDGLDLTTTPSEIDVHATVTATLPVRPVEVAAIQADLRRFVDPRIRLTVRTDLRSEASATAWKTVPNP